MRRHFKACHLLYALPAVCVVLLVACGGGSEPPKSPAAPTGTPTSPAAPAAPVAPAGNGTLAVKLTDSPFSEATALLITFSEVTAHTTDDNWVTLSFTGSATSRTCDLKRLVGGVYDVLGTTSLAEGHYTQLRLTVSSAKIYANDGDHWRHLFSDAVHSRCHGSRHARGRPFRDREARPPVRREGRDDDDHSARLRRRQVGAPDGEWRVQDAAGDQGGQRPVREILCFNRRMPATHVLILAAGKGTRMKSARPKVLHQVAGAPMIDYVLDAAAALGAATRTVVVGHEAAQVQAALAAHADLRFVLQEPQLGTAHAVQQAAPLFAGVAGTLVLLSGDVPLLSVDTLRALLARHEETGAAVTILTALVAEPLRLRPHPPRRRRRHRHRRAARRHAGRAGDPRNQLGHLRVRPRAAVPVARPNRRRTTRRRSST